MSTQQLIDAALAAKDDFDNAQTAMQNATAALQKARVTLDAANQALHDDLATNGPYAAVEQTTTPITVTLYTSQDPDSWNATPIRSA